MPEFPVLDTDFFAGEIKNRANLLLAQVADSFMQKGDKGAIVITIKLEQSDDKGHLSSQVEVASKNAKYTSNKYTGYLSQGKVLSGQMKMTDEELGGNPPDDEKKDKKSGKAA